MVMKLSDIAQRLGCELRGNGETEISGVNGLDEAGAADTIYTLMAPEVHHMLTVERGWSADRYERWLGNALCALLLPPPAPQPTPDPPPRP